VERLDIILVYVSGRSKSLMKTAIETFEIPIPQYAVGDVGTTLYKIDSGYWRRIEDWEEEIAPDWQGFSSSDLAKRLRDIDGLVFQEPEKQSRFKLSFYASLRHDQDELLRSVTDRIGNLAIRASLIWSVDDERQVGLLDVLPERATKLHAVRFLKNQLEIDECHTLFAGDSGNDLPALTSELHAILVANARAEVRDVAVLESELRGTADRLYLAQGNWLGLNGNYSAGVLEGIAHFIPEAQFEIARLLRA
jgi:HAD superfamily hydrolase (TIGR01484 family)